jgi:nucleotide-binding universal stress UspA family protein
MEERGLFVRALQDFQHARSQAALEKLTARLTRRPVELLSFDEVREKLHLAPAGPRKIENIPLDAIIGSVGRYSDFTRSYWPLSDSDDQRWARVKMAVSDLAGVPPIEVYQIGNAFFVKDGNHRVSVFREMGASHIQAHVIQLATKVPLSPDDNSDDIIIKAEYLDFLEKTQLDKLRPEADIRVSVPGAYQNIFEHIQIFQHYLSQAQDQPISFSTAVTEWYDKYYSVVIDAINRLGIRRDFPGHTDGDIYMRVWKHRGSVLEKIKIAVSVDWATRDLAEQQGQSPEKILARLYKNIIPKSLSSGPAPGKWRERIASIERLHERLFGYVLVSLGATEHRIRALEQAIIIAHKENSTLYGLHVIPSGESVENLTIQEIKTSFKTRCADAKVEGYFSFAEGKITHQIIARANWTDLMVAALSYPPGKKGAGKFSPGFDTLIRTSPTPVLSVPGNHSQFRRALVAYDGSPKAREALFIAVYMANRWQTELVIITVPDEKLTTDEMANMHLYLDQNLIEEPIYIEGQPPVPIAIIQTVDEKDCDLILMGGYGKTPVLEMLLGSTVDEVLRNSRVPVLVCR